MTLRRILAAIVPAALAAACWQHYRRLATGEYDLAMDGTVVGLEGLASQALALGCLLAALAVLFAPARLLSLVDPRVVLLDDWKAREAGTTDPAARLNTSPRLIHRSEDGLIDW